MRRMKPVLLIDPPKSGDVIDIAAWRSGTSARTISSSWRMYSSMY